MKMPFINTYVDLVRHNRQFRYLWLSQVISLFGDWFNLIASAALVAGLSNSAGLAIGGLFLARLLPPFILTPFVGVVADRFNRRNILIATDLLRVFVVLCFLLVRTEEQIWLLYALTVLQLSISAFFEPTRAAILPNIVSRENLVTANALSGTTWSVMLALGAGLGGLATAFFGITTAFLIDALTFIVSAWFVSRIHLAANLDSETDLAESGWSAFVAGVAYLRQRPAVLVIAFIKGSAALAFGGMAVVEVTFAEKIFPMGTDGSGTLGLIYFIVGLGTGLGPIIAQYFTGDNPAPMKRTILLTYALMVVGYLLVGNSTTLSLFLLGTFIRTVGSGTSWVYSSALLQMLVPDKFLGRVFAFDFAMMTLASAASTLWVGWAMDGLALTPQQVALALGIVPLIMFFAWGYYLATTLGRREVLSA